MANVVKCDKCGHEYLDSHKSCPYCSGEFAENSGGSETAVDGELCKEAEPNEEVASSHSDEIARIESLRDAGTITDEEFDTLKKKYQSNADASKTVISGLKLTRNQLIAVVVAIVVVLIIIVFAFSNCSGGSSNSSSSGSSSYSATTSSTTSTKSTEVKVSAAQSEAKSALSAYVKKNVSGADHVSGCDYTYDGSLSNGTGTVTFYVGGYIDDKYGDFVSGKYKFTADVKLTYSYGVCINSSVSNFVRTK